MTDQLWQLLIKFERLEAGELLTCTECFAIIELLVAGAEVGIERQWLEKMARDHLAHCPNCREQIEEMLVRIEEMINQSERSG